MISEYRMGRRMNYQWMMDYHTPLLNDPYLPCLSYRHDLSSLLYTSLQIWRDTTIKRSTMINLFDASSSTANGLSARAQAPVKLKGTLGLTHHPPLTTHCAPLTAHHAPLKQARSTYHQARRPSGLAPLATITAPNRSTSWARRSTRRAIHPSS